MNPCHNVLFYHLSVKTMCLIPCQPRLWLSEIQDLMADSLYTVFHKDRFILRHHLKFLPKVVLDFHISQFLVLPVFFCKLQDSLTDTKLHSLDMVRDMSFCLSRTKPSLKSSQLCVTFGSMAKEQAVSSQRLSKWVTGYIKISYSFNKLPLPSQVKTHITRAS